MEQGPSVLRTSLFLGGSEWVTHCQFGRRVIIPTLVPDSLSPVISGDESIVLDRDGLDPSRGHECGALLVLQALEKLG